jgi:hypothetical protein
MQNSHDRTADPDLAKQLIEFREVMDEQFTAVNLRIDHLIGRHDFAPHHACVTCGVRRAA